jgi:PAS domain S-box-containing protein
VGLKEFVFSDVPLRRVVVLPIILLVTASAFLSGLLAIRSGEKAVEDVSRNLSNEITGNIQFRLQSYLSVPDIICTLNAEMTREGHIRYDDLLQLQSLFLTQVKRFPEVSSIYFGNVRGGLADAGRDTPGDRYYVIGTDKFEAGTFLKFYLDEDGSPSAEPDAVIPDFDSRTRSWYTQAVEAEGISVRSEPYLVFTGDHISVSTSQAVYSDSGDLLGVISCDLFLTNLGHFLCEMKIGKTGFAFITDSSGRIFARSRDPQSLNATGPITLEETGDPILIDISRELDSLTGGFSGVEELTEFTVGSGNDLAHCSIAPFRDAIGNVNYIAVVIPNSDFMEPMTRHKQRSLLLLAIVLTVSALLGLAAAHFITKPVLQLHRTTTALSRGESEEFKSFGITELNELSISFAELTGKLNRSNAELRDEIQERLSAEKALLRSEERMELAIRGTGAATWDWNLLSGSIKVNPRWAEMLGYDLQELTPVTDDVWRKYTQPDDFQEAYKNLEDHFAGKTPVYEAEFRMRHRDGQWIWVLDRGMVMERDENGKPVRVAGTHVDITKRKNAEANQQSLKDQISKSLRLDSIGKLAGGVAHDLNNLLTPVLGYSEMLIDSETDDARKSFLKEILKAGKSARGLVNQLLAFGRRQYLELKTIDLNAILKDHSALIRSSVRENIELDLKLNDSPVPVQGDESKLEQVLMNLVVNAGEAMPEGGELRVETGIIEFAQEDAPDGLSGRCAILLVADTGTGLSEEEIDRIFDPFYTTKGSSGTGLGLSTVYGIVKQHSGTVDVASKRGIGTTFRVILPLSDEIPSGPTSTDRFTGESSGELVLVVEDSVAVREFTETALGIMGYRTVSTVSGDHALEVLQTGKIKPALMITDVIMPGIGVEELRRKACDMIPGLKVIYVSGYSGDVICYSDESGKSVSFLQKPFTIEELAEAVNTALYDG